MIVTLFQVMQRSASNYVVTKRNKKRCNCIVRMTCVARFLNLFTVTKAFIHMTHIKRMLTMKTKPFSLDSYGQASEIEQLSERLFHAMEPSIMSYVHVNLQHQTSSWSNGDDAPAP